MTPKYFIEYHAYVGNDHLQVSFQRLYRDGRDIMCDSLKPQWEPEDEFIIHMAKLRTTRYTKKIRGGTLHGEDVETLETMRFKTYSKAVANHVWYLAKHGASYDDIKGMLEAKKF